MHKFKAGLFLISFFILFFIMCFCFGENESENFVGLLVPGLFLFIGLRLLISGFLKMLKDWKTKKHGEQCYAIIKDIQATGVLNCDHPEYKAIMSFVNPITYQVETIEEIIDFDKTKYPSNSYVLCKYFKNDINIESAVSKNDVPGDIKKLLLTSKECVSNLFMSIDGKFIIIDGYVYEKI